MRTNPITPARGHLIRERFRLNAIVTRVQATEAEALGRHVDALHLRRLADSQERMATKRYESMRLLNPTEG